MKAFLDYESSSDEDDVVVRKNSEYLIEDIFKNYNNICGNTVQSRTKNFIKESHVLSSSTCLICISKIKIADEIWNCIKCFGIFHLTCIQIWSKDSIVQQKQDLNQNNNSSVEIDWCCPKCRHLYKSNEYPKKYLCFCGKSENPKYQPLLLPHSCGETCKKDLLPTCGHKCLLLCHPGLCPPCPVTIKISCFCRREPETIRRCSNRYWSCQKPCNKPLQCKKHFCKEDCHDGLCKPCPKKSIQNCRCGLNKTLRSCADPKWQCNNVCNKALKCGNHNCSVQCHPGVCPDCPLTQLRYCPCGKSSFVLPCTIVTPNCGLTCNKLLECGKHYCNYRCHKDKCSTCSEVVQKTCRCQQHTKEIQCSKSYFCDTKCRKIKDCKKHLCNRKCCDGHCPPCEKPCGANLQCGNHKCSSRCHRGLCYPCQEVKLITCRCGKTKLEVACGRKQKIIRPKCGELCKIPAACQHIKRENHLCHYGECPPCKQVCGKPIISCGHKCLRPCHSAVVVKIGNNEQKNSMPWERNNQLVEVRNLACPPCDFTVLVTCLGGHESANYPCHLAKSSNCGRLCGRLLKCTNHTCSFECHKLNDSSNLLCEECEKSCSKPRPKTCNHRCPKQCHSGECPPCKEILKMKCHCNLTDRYIQCSKWSLHQSTDLLTCGNQCPKNYECGHRCRSNCHPGSCPFPELCKRKVKVFCSCKRIKKEIFCNLVRAGHNLIECDQVCFEIQEKLKKEKENLNNLRKEAERINNLKELEEYEKKFLMKKSKSKNKKKNMIDNNNAKINSLQYYWIIIISTMFFIISLITIYFL